MPYKISYASPFKRDVKGFKKEILIKAAIQTAVLDIIENPTIGEKMTGNWEGATKYAFHAKPELRILYVVYNCCKLASDTDSCLFDEPIHSEDEAKEEEEPEEEAWDVALCSGFIEFLFVRTREKCNNLYAESKKYTKGFFREEL